MSQERGGVNHNRVLALLQIKEFRMVYLRRLKLILHPEIIDPGQQQILEMIHHASRNIK